MDGRTDQQMYGLMDGCSNGWTDRQVHGQMDRVTDRQTLINRCEVASKKTPFVLFRCVLASL